MSCAADPRRHYLVRFGRLLIWSSGGDEEDLVAVDDEGRVLTFDDRPAAEAWAAARSLPLEPDDVADHDLAAVEAWLASPADPIDCALLLNAWNLLGDVARTVTGDLHAFEPPLPGDEVGALYDEVFHGTNLPALRRPGEHHVPTWSPEQRASLAGLLGRGLALLRASAAPSVRAKHSGPSSSSGRARRPSSR